MSADLSPPLAALLELTHRCPLQCPYCSNPLELERAKGELSTAEWLRVMDETADLGILQVHFSGGEPAVRRDLPDLVAHARKIGLYSNLITSGVTLDQPRIAQLKEAGLDHVQLSIQDVDHQTAAFIANYPGVQGKKLAFARMVKEAGLPLTINAVLNRHNITRVERMIDLAVALGAGRVEMAHAQYYGWAIKNRAALMPTLPQVHEATRHVEAARERLRGQIVIDYVLPDYYARQPKACMGGWGRQFLNITPQRRGAALPRRANDSRDDVRLGPAQAAGGDLDQLAGVRALPRHRLDAGPVPDLRSAGSGLGRLPVSGTGGSGRRSRHRSRLRAVAEARRVAGARR